MKSWITSHTAAASLSLRAELCWLSHEYLKSFFFFLLFFFFNVLAICKSWKNRNWWLFACNTRSLIQILLLWLNYFPFFDWILYFLLSFILVLLTKAIYSNIHLLKSIQYHIFLETYLSPVLTYLWTLRVLFFYYC